MWYGNRWYYPVLLISCSVLGDATFSYRLSVGVLFCEVCFAEVCLAEARKGIFLPRRRGFVKETSATLIAELLGLSITNGAVEYLGRSVKPGSLPLSMTVFKLGETGSSVISAILRSRNSSFSSSVWKPAFPSSSGRMDACPGNERRHAWWSMVVVYSILAICQLWKMIACSMSDWAWNIGEISGGFLRQVPFSVGSHCSRIGTQYLTSSKPWEIQVRRTWWSDVIE